MGMVCKVRGIQTKYPLGNRASGWKSLPWDAVSSGFAASVFEMIEGGFIGHFAWVFCWNMCLNVPIFQVRCSDLYTARALLSAENFVMEMYVRSDEQNASKPFTLTNGWLFNYMHCIQHVCFQMRL